MSYELIRLIILDSPSFSETTGLNPRFSRALVETMVLAQNFLMRMLLMGKRLSVMRSEAPPGQ